MKIKEKSKQKQLKIKDTLKLLKKYTYDAEIIKLDKRVNRDDLIKIPDEKFN